MNELGNSRPSRQFAYQQLATANGSVEFADLGQGSPVLYFHGTGAGIDAVVTLEQPLIDQNFRLIIPHRPGYYGTPLTHGGSPDECADLAVAVLDHLKIERAAIIGTSGGGLVLAVLPPDIRRELRGFFCNVR